MQWYYVNQKPYIGMRCWTVNKANFISANSLNKSTSRNHSINNIGFLIWFDSMEHKQWTQSISSKHCCSNRTFKNPFYFVNRDTIRGTCGLLGSYTNAWWLMVDELLLSSEITKVWVPGHSGILGNESADLLAKRWSSKCRALAKNVVGHKRRGKNVVAKMSG